MRTTRTNSFRLHHVSKTGSVRKSSQSFYEPDELFKLATLNSVNRGVKHADLSFLTGSGLNKLRVEPHEAKEGEYNSAHHNLTEVRKKYDEMKKQTALLEQKIQKQKEQIQKLNIFKSEFEDKIGQATSKAAILNQQLQFKKQLLQDTVTQKKVLSNMQTRHRTDKIFYDQKKFDLDKELSYLRKQLYIFQKEGFQIEESEDRTAKIYEKLSNELEGQQQERETHIHNLQDMIEEKLQLLNANIVREADLSQIAERAIQDKDLTEKNWRKIFQTHVLVNKLLRGKIEKEMEKFKVVECAFREIKISTGVSDAKSLIQKYVNKETVYGELLGRISENQKTIEHLRNETEVLMQQSKNLQMELQVIQSIKIKQQDLHDPLKELEQYDQKATKAETYQNKTAQWTVRQLKKLSAIDQNHLQIDFPKTTHTLLQAFTKYFAILKRESDVTQQLIPLSHNDGGLDDSENQKMTRVIPKQSRLNSSGEEVFDVDEEDTHPNSQFEEEEVINSQREELLRNNQKFMRDIRRKKQNDRSLFLQKYEAKKQPTPKVPEPKKAD